jgi:5,10-methylenetetrahydrofolate reductase
MTLRQYAAIHLKVPQSGLPWLDEMINEARRDAFARQALAGLLALRGDELGWESASVDAYKYADAMIEAGRVK